MKIKIPSPISGGLILSYKCSAQCNHCIYACSPKWDADWISEENMERILDGLAGNILPNPNGPETTGLNYGLHFTGGEPFVNFDLLCRAVEIANELDIPSTFVETNGFWCANDKDTKEKMQTLYNKGLKGIMISVNPFYLEFVPFERTERAVRIALEVFGLNTMIYQIEYFKRFKEWGIKDQVSFKDYLMLENNNDLFRNVEFFVSVRAPYRLNKYLEDLIPKHPPSYFFNMPCVPEFLRSWHNHFDNYGNYLPGYCGGLSLGSCLDLKNLLREGIEIEEYPILRFFVNNDMGGLFTFAKEFGYKEPREGLFSKCHLCIDIRKHLVDRGDFKELKPGQFYLYLE